MTIVTYDVNCQSDFEYESTHTFARKIPEEYLAMSESGLKARIKLAKEELGDELFIMAHHYQKDEIVEFADVIGDSLYLSQQAAKNKLAKHIVFCGVHFMAETAAMLTDKDQHVYLPDESAGCFMADMANLAQVETAWAELTKHFDSDILPITYVNSTAEIKAFVGQNGGTCVTSTNAKEVVKWALEQGKRVLFLPDQHLGRNTAFSLGVPLEQMALWKNVTSEYEFAGDDKDCRVILWDGYCGVHQQFTLQNVQDIRAKVPGIQVIVHPECRFEVVQAADESGSTNKLLQIVDEAQDGTSFAIGTDNNLVGRIKQQYKKTKRIEFLNPYSCACITMNRIRLPHLAWNLDNILDGDFIQEITVNEETTKNSLRALNKMFELTKE